LARTIASSPEAKRPLAAFAHASVAERIGVVFGALPSALPEENVAQQHALRIDFKRLRYAVEVFAPVYAEQFDPIHDTLTAFQDTLGDLHDEHLFLDLLGDPELVAGAARAGVSAADLGEVTALLEKRAKATFDRFVALTVEHPAGELLPALLLPLSQAPEPLKAEEPPAEPPPPEPGQPAAPDEQAASPAVVLEAPAVVEADGMPPIDPTAQPWRSDAAGLAIDPPVVIGAEPWARSTLEAAGATTDEPVPAVPALEEHR